MILRVERFASWEELKAAAIRYASLGIRCEVRGFEDMRFNKLTIYGDYGNDS